MPSTDQPTMKPWHNAACTRILHSDSLSLFCDKPVDNHPMVFWFGRSGGLLGPCLQAGHLPVSPVSARNSRGFNFTVTPHTSCLTSGKATNLSHVQTVTHHVQTTTHHVQTGTHHAQTVTHPVKLHNYPMYKLSHTMYKLSHTQSSYTTPCTNYHTRVQTVTDHVQIVTHPVKV